MVVGTRMRSGIVTVVLSVMFCLPVYADDTDIPTCDIRIPVVLDGITVDGDLSPQEWADAAIIRDLKDYAPKGDEARFVPKHVPKTTFYVGYDNEALYVAARCIEPMPGYPKAFPRESGDALTQDDSIQVVLGVGDDTMPQTIEVGGYPDALGTALPPVAHIYQYTVNAVGQAARSYNEGPCLDRTGFTAGARIQNGGYCVEMRIPFSSAGIVAGPGQTLYVNMIRFRPPETFSWKPVGFGYRPMRFGVAAMLAAEQQDLRTTQAYPAVTQQDASQTRRYTKSAITYYPLAGLLVAKSDMDADKVDKLVLRVADTQYITTTTGIDEDVYLRVPDLPAGTYSAILEYVDRKDTVIHKAEHSFNVIDRPEWSGTKECLEYVHERIPQPWSMPQIEDHTVHLDHCDITFGRYGLPSSIVYDGREMMAGEGAIDVSIAGKTVVFTPEDVSVRPEGHSVVIDAFLTSSQAALQTKVLLEYDGFMVVKFRIVDVDPASVDHISLDIPLDRHAVRFINRGHSQDTIGYDHYGYEGPEGYLWAGTYDRGMAVSHDTPVFFTKNIRNRYSMQTTRDGTCIHVNMVDGKHQVPDDDYIFRLFLQPTPTKAPERLYTIKDEIKNWFEWWSDYQGYPDLKKIPQVKEHADESHAEGFKQFVYFSHSLAENSPPFPQFKDEFITIPVRKWGARAYGVGKGIPTWVCCVRGAYGDLLLNGIARLADEADLDGVYMDGTTLAFTCTNPSHLGCNNEQTISWDTITPTRIVGTRNFLKRLRGIFDSRGRTGPMLYSHTGGGLDIHLLSLCDIYREGEQLNRFLPGFRVPLSKFVVGYTGWPWGYSGAAQYSKAFEINNSCYGMLTWTLLHNSEAIGEYPAFSKELLREFRSEGATFYPYWKKQNHIAMTRGDMLYSYYLGKNKALLVVSNLGWEGRMAGFDISGLGIDSPVAWDADHNQPVEIHGQSMLLDVPAWLFRAIVIQSQDTFIKPEAAETSLAQQTTASDLPKEFHLASFSADAWVAGPHAEVLLGDETRKMNCVLPVWVTPDNKNRCSYTLADYEFGEEVLIRLKLQSRYRLEFGIGPLNIQFNGKKVIVHGGSTRDIHARYYQLPRYDPDRISTVEIAIKDRILDIRLDEKPLVVGARVLHMKPHSNLQLRTWGGNWFAFDIIEISNCYRAISDRNAISHPIQ